MCIQDEMQISQKIVLFSLTFVQFLPETVIKNLKQKGLNTQNGMSLLKLYHFLLSTLSNPMINLDGHLYIAVHPLSQQLFKSWD